MSGFTAVLLAGGRSSRMGRDKALAEIDGVPLWRRQLDTLAACDPNELLISGPSNGPWAASGVAAVEDRESGTGPLGGVARALEVAKFPLVMVLAVDMPRVTAKLLLALMSCSGNGLGVVPDTSNGLEPLAAIFPKSAAVLARLRLESGERSMRGFVEALVRDGSMTTFHVENDAIFQNANTEMDLRRIADGIRAEGEKLLSNAPSPLNLSP